MGGGAPPDPAMRPPRPSAKVLAMDIEPFGVTLFQNDPEAGIRASSHLGGFRIARADGTRIGTLHGILLRSWHGDGISIAGDTITVPDSVDGFGAFERTVLDGLHGSYVILTCPPLGQRLYQDAGGSIPVVFCPESRRLGSSAAMFMDDEEYAARFDTRLHRANVAGDISGSWITGTLTAHSGVFRLLPNFFLDLETWQARRFWPKVEGFRLDMSLGRAINTIAPALAGFSEAAAREMRIGITMTAGFDSRVLIAASRNVADRVEYFTFGAPGAGVDQVMAVKISADLGLRHRFVPVIRASGDEKRHWDRLVGDVVRESTRDFFPTLRDLPYDAIFTGMYGETGRIRLYRQDASTINSAPATAEFVLSRLTLPKDPQVVRNIEEWLAPIAGLPRSAVLDLAFNELRFGSWAMGQGPVQKAMKPALMPMAQRVIQDAFMRMEPTEQGPTALFEAVARRLWPETMDFPVNRYGDWRDALGRFAKFTSRDSLVRYIRDRFA